MPRPALSASRGIEIVDLLAAFPDRALTLSEIARAARINVASCHAVLGALVHRGYLTRETRDRTYRLGPALIAAGAAALRSQPRVARAQQAAQALASDLQVPVLLSALVGEEIVALASIADASGRGPGMRVGERMPLVLPVGAPFLAWSSEAAIEAWIGTRATHGEETAAAWRQSLAATRKRGYQVTLRSPGSTALASLLAEMASRREIHEYKDEVLSLMKSWDRQLLQPELQSPTQFHDVVLIAAPIFNESGESAYSLCLGGFSEPISGAMIEKYASQLVRSCLAVMGADLPVRTRIVA